tara:strand:- start:275 stop:583 length:309 start_codon:yes stop_codon:yes gene_type:complete
MSHCCKPESNCVCCNKTRIKAPWDNCLDSCGKDISANKLCKKPVFLPTNSTIQPSPSQQSVKFRTANIVKNPGNTVYGRWTRAKYNPKTRKYTMLNGARTTY